MARDKGIVTQHERSTAAGVLDAQPEARESPAGPPGKSERPIVPTKPGNAGGGKGPHFQSST
jgi:hypothetical protein